MVSDHIKSWHQVLLTLDRNRPTHRFTQSLDSEFWNISTLDEHYQIQSVLSGNELQISGKLSFENILRFRLELVLEH